MKKWHIAIVASGLMFCLSGCNLSSEPINFIAKADEGITPWSMSNETVAAAIEPTDVSNKTTAELPDVQLEADILGVYEISDIEDMHNLPISQLTAGKEYEVTARILLSTQSDAIMGRQLDFMLECPLWAESGKSSALAVEVFADGSALLRHEFTITTTADNLHLSYVPGTYQIWQSGDVHVELLPEMMIWNENERQKRQTLEYLLTPSQQLEIYEYFVSYRIKAEVSTEQQSEAEERAENPITLRLRGISQVYSDARDTTSASWALNDCLKEDYMRPESILCDGTVYLVAEINLPTWAREYAQKYGLKVTWYNYHDAPGCGIGVTLPNLPDNLGHVEESYTDLVLNTLLLENEGMIGTLMPYPTTPLSIWSPSGTDEAFSSENLGMIAMPTEGRFDSRFERDVVSQLLGGEIIAQLPDDGRFYIAIGVDLVGVDP